MQAMTNYQLIDLASNDYLLIDPQALPSIDGEALEQEERMVTLVSPVGSIQDVARCVIDNSCAALINEWLINVDCIDALEDKKLKFLSASPDLLNITRFVIDVSKTDTKDLERCTLVKRIALIGDAGNPFDTNWDDLRSKWVQYLLWCAEKVNVAYTNESFQFISPWIIPRLNKPVGKHPKTFLIYSGL